MCDWIIPFIIMLWYFTCPTLCSNTTHNKFCKKAAEPVARRGLHWRHFFSNGKQTCYGSCQQGEVWYVEEKDKYLEEVKSAWIENIGCCTSSWTEFQQRYDKWMREPVTILRHGKESLFVLHISTRPFKVLRVKPLRASQHNAKEN